MSAPTARPARHVAVRLAPCPACGAGRGDPCSTQRGGPRVSVHAARMAQAVWQAQPQRTPAPWPPQRPTAPDPGLPAPAAEPERARVRDQLAALRARKGWT